MNKYDNKHLSVLGAWAFSIGTSVGWGSLVVTSSSYLGQAGPAGSVIGLILGTVLMLLVGRCYAYLMRCYPENGGAYAYTREIFGHDQSFLTAWFLIMTYLAVLWANMTSLPLFGRIFLGGFFSFGKLYTIFGYDVYLGEVLLSVAGLLGFGFMCTRSAKTVNRVMIGFALTFTAATGIAFLRSVFAVNSPIEPLFLPETSAIRQIAMIAVITPWAFIGFESISHQAENFTFGKNRFTHIMRIAAISTSLLYIVILLLSVEAYPPQYANWLEYIRDLDNLSGIEALPTFYAAWRCMGNAGVWMLMLALLALVMSSLIGNITALSRLIMSLAQDHIIPRRFAEENAFGAPARSIWLVCVASLAIPLVGRTAIGWIVDVTTIGAILIYGFVAACTQVLAMDMGEKKEMWIGRITLIMMIGLGIYYLLPNLVTRGSIAPETYFLFIIWTALCFIAFRLTLNHDLKKRFGRSLSVWLALLSLLLLISLIWMRQSMLSSYSSMVGQVDSYYQGITTGTTGPGADAGAIRTIMDGMAASNTRTTVMTIAMFAFALIIMMTNHSFMNRRSKESEDAANRDPMTGVFSKHAYLDKEKQIDAELSEGVLRDFSIVVCDVNGLKKINDTYGHKAGDDYIQKASTMLCSIFSHSQMYRVGGDEFVALLTGRDHTVRQELMAELHDRSVANISTAAAGAQAVVSGGISDYIPGTDHSVHEIFERADAAMYEEKMRLKSLGAVTRDEEPVQEVPDTPEIENIPMINVRRHVLIAEDELVNREMLGNLLQDDYELLYAGDGIETLESIREHKDELALLLLDLNMPGMTGIEILTAMKADSTISSIPVIVMTADQQAELECLKLGAIDFIPKPYPIWEIVKARVAKCIELAETRDLIQHTQRDNLTGLFNLDYFIRYVDRYDQQYWDVAMDAVVIDVNRFHLINERYGRQYGDIILRRIGENVRKLARRIGGIGCRRGGDTFLIYCPHRDEYDQLLEKLSADIIKEEASASRVHLRMGVYPEADKEIAAERRFDRAKIAADSRISDQAQTTVGIYNEEMGKEALYKEKLVEDFKLSVTNNQFKIYLQPKYDIHGSTPVVMGAEALVRWDHPELGLINPSMFIPVLEENGLILELDRFVWTETAAQIRKWKDKGGHSVPVSFNVSRVDMLNPNLRNIFHEILDTYRLTTDDIILEITESSYMGDSEQIIATARELHSMGMGFRIEIDDFGTGYSSLSMLRDLPIDALKLDMALTKPTLEGDGEESMIRLIIDIAQYLQVPVVAEGVETEEQYRLLKELGCGFAQGYFFSKPIPKEDFDYYLEEGRHLS